MFLAHVIAALISNMVVTSVQSWMFAIINIVDIRTSLDVSHVHIPKRLPRLHLVSGGIGPVVWQNMADALGTPLCTMAQGQTFNPSSW